MIKTKNKIKSNLKKTRTRRLKLIIDDVKNLELSAYSLPWHRLYHSH
jgi:hypothetical protein